MPHFEYEVIGRGAKTISRRAEEMRSVDVR